MIKKVIGLLKIEISFFQILLMIKKFLQVPQKLS